MAEPANRKTNAAGGKYYDHPVTGEKFDSVTTVLDLVDKAALKQWAANLAADFALEHLGAIMNAQIEPPCGNTHNRCYQKHGRAETCERCPCGKCEACWRRRIAYRHEFESHRRADEGTEVHEAINHWILSGGEIISLTNPAIPYFQTFLLWAQDFGLRPRTHDDPGSWEQTEVTLLNREHMYAGTSDGALWLRRGRGRALDLVEAILDRLGVDEALVRVDYKTREKPDERLYMDMPLQGAAYEHCPVAMLPDGQEFPAPDTVARFVLQLRPEEYTFKPMISTGSFEAFLGVLTAYRWIQKYGSPKAHPIAFDLATVLPFPCAHPIEARSTLNSGLVVCTRCQAELGQGPSIVSDRARLAEEAAVEIATGKPVETVDALAFDDPWMDSPEPPGPSMDPWPDPSEMTPQRLNEIVATPAVQDAIKTSPAKAARSPRKAATKKATKKAAEPAAGSAILDSLRTFDPGKPQMSALAEEIPY